LEGERVTDVELSFEYPQELDGKVLQVGKKRFVRLVQ
jgi:tyrosyl-tRNA synthetase